MLDNLITIFVVAFVLFIGIMILTRKPKAGEARIATQAIPEETGKGVPWHILSIHDLPQDQWQFNEATGEYFQILPDGTKVTWNYDPSGQVANEAEITKDGKEIRERGIKERAIHRRENLERAANGIKSDWWWGMIKQGEEEDQE